MIRPTMTPIYLDEFEAAMNDLGGISDIVFGLAEVAENSALTTAEVFFIASSLACIYRELQDACREDASGVPAGRPRTGPLTMSEPSRRSC